MPFALEECAPHHQAGLQESLQSLQDHIEFGDLTKISQINF
jgi:hypothetical protein